MRWPVTWKDPAALGLLKGAAIDCLLMEKGLEPVAAAARQMGLTVVDPAAPPEGIRIVKGDWPGIRLPQGAGGHGGAGPTGVPWVDANGWKVRVESALHPRDTIWIDAPPTAPFLAAGAYALAIADAASHGGRWIVTLKDAQAAAIAAGNAPALERWKEVTTATAFFAGRSAASSAYTPQAVVGVVSSFTGEDEFLSHEVLNLLSRANQQYRVLVKSAPFDPQGLRALLYVDGGPIAPELRSRLMAFASAGGLLIVGPKWGGSTGAPVRDLDHPRYEIHQAGKGRIAIAKADAEDPYLVANDSVVLVSHRYELFRFWNCGAVGSYLTVSADRKHALAHLLFYANRGPSDATVRITGRYRSANLWTLDRAESRSVELHTVGDGVEVHLPQVNQYAAIELEA